MIILEMMVGRGDLQFNVGFKPRLGSLYSAHSQSFAYALSEVRIGVGVRKMRPGSDTELLTREARSLSLDHQIPLILVTLVCN
jgi:hypothetical protein